jgi:hypothetical protein
MKDNLGLRRSGIAKNCPNLSAKWRFLRRMGVCNLFVFNGAKKQKQLSALFS